MQNMFVINDKLDHLEEKFSRIIQVFLSKKLDPDPVQLCWIRIRPGQKVPDPTGSNPQHCHRPLVKPKQKHLTSISVSDPIQFQGFDDQKLKKIYS
jgi:hypothetical protein